ncbi:serine/threonine-protein kinase [Actinotignum timonense]|nr:serine/threonine-protein kinase [Actinotignum timonense]
MSTAFDFGASYRALAPIGRGASGVVYEGERKDDGTRVAIKFLRDEYVGDPEILRRFITERSVLTQLSHPHIVGVHDLVADGGKLGIVMEYAPGPNLREYLAEHGPLAPADALDITRQVVEALQSAHAGDVVHRDIKPDNIILTGLAPDAAVAPDTPATAGKDKALPGRKKLRGRTEAEDRFNVKVTDFGIAAIIGTGSKTTSIVGTPDYMAPELIAQARATPSVDMYAVGIMLYEMLTGRTPFGGEGLNPFTIAHRHLTEKIAPLAGLEENTAALLDELVGKNPDTRPDAAQVLDRLPACVEASAGQDPLELNPSAPVFYPATMLDGAFNAAALAREALGAAKDTEKEAPARPAVVLSRESLGELDAAPSATIISSGAALDLNYVPAPVIEREPSFWEKTGSFIREHWILVTLGVVTLLAAIAGVVWMLWP